VDVLTGKPNYPEGKVFSGYSAGGCLTENHQGISIFRVPLLPRGKKNPIKLAVNYICFVLTAGVFGPWLLRNRSADVILVYAPSPLIQAIPALLIGWLKNAPVAVYVQDLWPDSIEATGYIRNAVILNFVRRVVAYVYSHAQLLLISSRPFEQQIRNIIPTAKIIYYPNSVEDSFCSPNNGLKYELPVLKTGFSVVFAGNVGSAQAVHVIVKAATLLVDYPEVRIVIFGSGSELDWMHQQITSLKLTNLYLAGRFPVEAMPFLLAKASALLVTLADRPIFAATVPSKIQTYMAVGRPIVASINGEGARLVTDADAGIAVPAENHVALADAILTLYRMTPDERGQLGSNARQYYRDHFDHEMLVTKLVVHLRDLVRGHL